MIRARRSIHSSSPHPKTASPNRSDRKGQLKNASFDDDSDEELDAHEQSLDGNTSNKYSSSYSYTALNADLRYHIDSVSERGDETVQNDSNRENKSYESKASPRRKRTHPTEYQSTQDTSFNFNVIIVIVVILVGVSSSYVLFANKNAAFKKVECPQFKELTKEFHNQDEFLWRSLKKGIENVLNLKPTQPSIFFLAYNDKKTSNILVSKILNATANCMQSQNPIQLDGGTFATEAMIKDYGEVIATYRKPLESEGILYVADVNKTPAKAAQAFHPICDTITPLVERSVIFFTMYVDQYDRHMPNPKILEMVQNQLENNWRAIDHNKLDPLIGRVTDQVFLLHSEKDIQ